MATTGQETESRTKVVVLGAGTMGAGIAQCLADHGREVTLTDVDPAALGRARQRIAASRATLETAARDAELTLERTGWLKRRADGFVPAVYVPWGANAT